MVSSSSVPLKQVSMDELMRFDELKLTGKALSSLEAGGTKPSAVCRPLRPMV